jgi:TonB family protein
MELRPHSGGVTAKRSMVAMAGIVALAILAFLPRIPHRQDVARQSRASPSATEESGISEPVGILEFPVRSDPAFAYRPRTKVPSDHPSASVGPNTSMATPVIRRDSASLSEEARVVEDSASSRRGLGRSDVLNRDNLESKLDAEARMEEGEAAAPVMGSDPQVTVRTPLLTPPVLLSMGPLRYPAEGYRIVVDHSVSASGVGIDAAEGRVRLKILVRADGSVGSVEVAQSSGRTSLDAIAVHEVSRWKFAPATRDGRPIDAWALVPLLFVLR